MVVGTWDLRFGICEWLPAEDDPKVAPARCRCTRLLLIARPLFGAQGGADDAPQVRRHHLDETALIVGERALRGGVGSEHAEYTIAVHERCADGTSELDPTIVEIERGVRVRNRLTAGRHPAAQPLADRHRHAAERGGMLAHD